MKMKKVVAALAALAMCASPNFAMAASEMGGALVAVAEQSAIDTDHASCFPEAYCTDANTYSYAFAPGYGAGNYGANPESNSAYYWHVLQHMDEKEASKYGGYWVLQEAADGKEYTTSESLHMLKQAYEVKYPEYPEQVVTGFPQENIHYGWNPDGYDGIDANNDYSCTIYSRLINEQYGSWKEDGYTSDAGHHFTATYNYLGNHHDECESYIPEGQYPLRLSKEGWKDGFPSGIKYGQSGLEFEWYTNEKNAATGEPKPNWGAAVMLADYNNPSGHIPNSKYLVIPWNPCRHMTEAERKAAANTAYISNINAIKSRPLDTTDYKIKNLGLPKEWYEFNKTSKTFTRYYYDEQDIAKLLISSTTCGHRYKDADGNMQTCQEITSEKYEIQWKARKMVYKFVEYVPPTEATQPTETSQPTTQPTQPSTEATEPVKDPEIIAKGNCSEGLFSYEITEWDNNTFDLSVKTNADIKLTSTDGNGDYDLGLISILISDNDKNKCFGHLTGEVVSSQYSVSLKETTDNVPYSTTYTSGPPMRITLHSNTKDSFNVAKGTLLYKAKIVHTPTATSKSGTLNTFCINGVSFIKEGSSIKMGSNGTTLIDKETKSKSIEGIDVPVDEYDFTNAYVGSAPIVIGGDYHDESTGINYSIKWNADKTLTVRYFNAVSDSAMLTTGKVEFPAFGIKGDCSFTATKGVINPSWTNITGKTQYNGKEINTSGWGSAYIPYLNISGTSPILSQEQTRYVLNECDNYFDIVVENYDGSVFTIGGVEFEAQETGNESVPYKIVKLNETADWAKSSLNMATKDLDMFTTQAVSGKQFNNVIFNAEGENIPFDVKFSIDSKSVITATLTASNNCNFSANSVSNIYFNTNAPADSTVHYTSFAEASAAGKAAAQEWVDSLNQKAAAGKSYIHPSCRVETFQEENGYSYTYTNITCTEVTNPYVSSLGKIIYSAESTPDATLANSCTIKLVDADTTVSGTKLAAEKCALAESTQAQSSWKAYNINLPAGTSGLKKGDKFTFTISPSTHLKKDADTFAVTIAGTTYRFTATMFESEKISIEKMAASNNSSLLGKIEENSVSPAKEITVDTAKYKATPVDGISDFMVGVDAHSDGSEINYSVAWLKDGTLDVKFYNRKSDVMLCNYTGSIILPGFGTKNPATVRTVRGEKGISLSKLNEKAKLPDGTLPDLNGWATAYKVSINSPAYLEKTLQTCGDYAHITVPNYDGSEFTIGGKVYKAEKTTGAVSEYQIVETTAAAPDWASLKHNLSAYASISSLAPIELKSEFTENVTLNGTKVPFKYNVSYTSGKRDIDVTMTALETANVDLINDANFGNFIFTVGSSVDPTKNNNLTGKIIDTTIDNIDLETDTCTLNADANKKWNMLRIAPKRTVFKGIQKGDTITLRFTIDSVNSNAIKANGGSFVIYLNGHSLVVKIDMMTNSKITMTETTDAAFNAARTLSANGAITYKYAPMIDGIPVGDVSDDGDVDSLDIIRINKYITGGGSMEDAAAADIDGNGVVDSNDSLLLLKYSLDIITIDDIKAIRAENKAAAGQSVKMKSSEWTVPYGQALKSGEFFADVVSKSDDWSLSNVYNSRVSLETVKVEYSVDDMREPGSFKAELGANANAAYSKAKAAGTSQNGFEEAHPETHKYTNNTFTRIYYGTQNYAFQREQTKSVKGEDGKYHSYVVAEYFTVTTTKTTETYKYSNK